MFDMPDAPRVRPGANARSVFRIIREAVFGDAPARLIPARYGVPLVVGVTGVYVALSALLPAADVAVPFAILPLSIAAVLLSASWSFVAAALIYATIFVSEELLVGSNRRSAARGLSSWGPSASCRWGSGSPPRSWCSVATPSNTRRSSSRPPRRR